MARTKNPISKEVELVEKACRCLECKWSKWRSESKQAPEPKSRKWFGISIIIAL